MAEDWDLFAIVRSCQSATTPFPQITTNNTSSVNEQNYDALSFPNIVQVQPITNEFQELHQLFKPFNPNSPYFASTPTFHDQQNQLQVLQKQDFQATHNNSPTVSLSTQPQTPKSRKRKIQQKKMVCHVTADNLSADLWAWRKYGQKPIKGSAYPRNYYKCSSSKCCMARKQVERSNTDPDMFIVTYTGDHSHPRPTHRNSLSGSTRSKTPATNPPPSPGLQSSFQAIAFTSSPPHSTTTLSEEPLEIAKVESDPEMETDVDDDGDIR